MSSMSNDDVGWRLDVHGRQVGPHKNETLDSESRLDWAERFVTQHERDIKQTRYEAASISAHLEKRIEGLERLVTFLGRVLIALIATLFAGLVAAYVQGDIYWLVGLALFVSLATFLAAQFTFRIVAASCLKSKSVTGVKSRPARREHGFGANGPHASARAPSPARLVAAWQRWVDKDE